MKNTRVDNGVQLDKAVAPFAEKLNGDWALER